MPYNPYNYNSPYNFPYQNNNLQYSQFGYNNLPTNQIQQQINLSSISVAIVPSIEQVEQVQMLPNERKIILLQNNPDFLAIRVADQAGFVKTEYRKSQVFDPKSTSEERQVQYAPIQAVVELKQKIDDLEKRISVKNANSNAKKQFSIENTANSVYNIYKRVIK